MSKRLVEDIKKSERYTIVRALMCGSLDPEEVMRTHSILYQEERMHGSILAFVYPSRKGRY